MATRVIVVGAGPIGLGVAREVGARPSLELVAVVDVDPKKAGLEVEGVPVTASLPAVDPQGAPTVAALTTTSSLAKLEPLVLDVIARGMHVVSTCEELAWPWRPHAQDARAKERDAIAHRIDDAARARGVCILGTGVNPGFLMDALPLALTAPCRRVERVRVERVQDASTRRRPFQDEVGVGLAADVVTQGLHARTLGHVGLEESARMIAARLALPMDAFVEDMKPIVADLDVTAHGRTVHAGETIGVEQVGRATHKGALVVELFFRATFGQRDPRDRIVVEGDPPLDVVMHGGVPGDVATCAIVANAIPVLLVARPGLRTMADVPLVVWAR
jgi:2,4-diaminopentanoate dehydrogenase